MSRSRTSIILCVIAVFAECLLPLQTSTAQTASPQVSDARTACAADIQKLCAGVAPGGGRILACLKQHKDQVSNGCKQAILSAMGKSGDSASSTANPASAAASPAPIAAPAGYGDNAGSAPTVPSGSQGKSDLPSKQSSRSSSAPAAISGEHYFVMKKVQIIDQGLGKGMPAYDLLIPKDWQFKGAVNVGVAEDGCFGDWFSVVATANNADSSMALHILPQSTWQYTDDPGGQQQMQAQNQNDMKYGMKACPVRAPIRAQDFLRQDMAKKCTGCTVVSVEPFPELAEMVRHQLGLPPTAAGANTGNTRVDAARMRITFNNTQEKPSEAWVTAAIVVHVMPGGGRGAAYDWHAVDVMTFGTPQGQLDANEKLFKLIVSTIHPEFEWEKMSNGAIASLYQMKAKQVAIQQQAISQFRQHAADVINGVTANQIKGANQASFGQDQLVRGVQTFRDPATGRTYELSNQYDHAWLNGANEYVMSDSPNFNPNGNLNGNWNQLEVVQPQP
jgi:Cysteine rich repeat